MFERELQKRVRAVQFEFGADVGPVIFDGAGADEEFACNFSARFVLCNQLQDSPFRRRQIIEAGFLFYERSGARVAIEQIAGKLRADEVPAFLRSANALDNIGHDAVFKHITFRARVHRFVE